MAVQFRNVEGSPSDPVTSWPYEGLVAVLEDGLVADWQPVITEIRRAPWGDVARAVEHFCTYCDDRPLATLFSLIVVRARERTEAAEKAAVAGRVREAIARSGLTAADFALRVGTSASRLSTYAAGRVMPSAAMLVRIESAAE